LGMLVAGGGLHIIQLSGVTRLMLLRGTGLYDYDFANCHPSIFKSLSAYHGLATPSLDKWVMHRSEVCRDYWSKYGIAPVTLKKLMLAILNGAPLRVSEKRQNTVTELLGARVADEFCRTPFMTGYKEEVDEATQVFPAIRNSPHRQSEIPPP